MFTMAHNYTSNNPNLIKALLSSFSLSFEQIKTKQINLCGVCESAKVFVSLEVLKQKYPVFWFVNSERQAEEIYQQLIFWLPNLTQKMAKYPEIETGIKITGPYLKQKIIQRQKILTNLLLNKIKILIIPINTLSQPLFLPEKLKKEILTIQQGQNITQNQIIKKLSKMMYKYEDSSVEPNIFSKKGGIIEIFPINMEHPVRIEFIGNKVEKIQAFQPKTKKGFNFNIKTLHIAPKEILTNRRPQNGLLKYLGVEKSLFILDNFESLQEKIQKIKLENKIKEANQLIFHDFPKHNTINLNFRSQIVYKDNLISLIKNCKIKQKEGWQIVIITKNKKSVQKLFLENEILFSNNPQNILSAPKKPVVIFTEKNSDLLKGFLNPKLKISLITDYEIFNVQKQKRKQKEANQIFISELKPYDLIVHIDHGIGRFIGTQKIKIDQGVKEFFVLEYAEGDKLFVPVEYAEKINKYIGGSYPKIHRLHGISWHETKQKIKKDAQRIAKELLEIYAHRETVKGFAFTLDSSKQKELEDSFQFEETPDQIKVLQEVKQDMESEKPMDRLICGDVGFGKTEIALRASFKAVDNKKQVAILAPTTILAQQHYDTFKKRLLNFPIKIGVLSRFESKKKQKEIINGIKRDKINIIIGTHRLLSPDVRFKNLGLLIIDEEQRFGVKDKEKLKKVRANVDILSLSATPIPRTLQLGLSGIKDISIIKTPPPGRKPIKTFIQRYSDGLIKKAVKEEKIRGGQIYFLHNRVETIELAAKKLKNLFDHKIKIEVAHGRLPEKKLAKIMHDFNNQKIDMLVCSTIIENGLDLPNVNTLIVDYATRFGLADLYQLRGRIGRSQKQAYAYFFYRAHELKEKAQKRLRALLEAKELGSGFQLAMKDLEIRGAGNVLGKEQSGQINAIGLSLYLKLLHQAIEELKTGKKIEIQSDITIDLPLSVFIPKTFIPSDKKRLKIYQKLANINQIKQLLKFKNKLYIKYGFLPREVINLFHVLHLKLLARKAKIKNIDTKKIYKSKGSTEQRIFLRFSKKLNYQKIYKLIKRNHNWHISEKEIKIDKTSLGEEWLKELKKSIKIFI